MMSTPKILHFMYMWQTPVDWMIRNLDEYRAMNPGWDVQFWTELPREFPAEGRAALDLAPTPRYKADIVRYWCLWQFGGVYCDIDTRPIRPMAELMSAGGADGKAFFCRYRMPRIPDNFLCGGPAGHTFWLDAFDVARTRELWRRKGVYFGAYNAYLRADRHPDALWLPPEATREIQDQSEYGELFAYPRVPLTGPEYIKHYRVCGCQTPERVPTGWEHPMQWEEAGKIVTTKEN
jgi:hypothetical protein